MRSTARSSNRSPTTLSSEYQPWQLLCVHSWRGTICCRDTRAGGRVFPHDGLSPAAPAEAPAEHSGNFASHWIWHFHFSGYFSLYFWLLIYLGTVNIPGGSCSWCCSEP